VAKARQERVFEETPILPAQKFAALLHCFSRKVLTIDQAGLTSPRFLKDWIANKFGWVLTSLVGGVSFQTDLLPTSGY
jgi:hypothetical protein